MKTLEALIKMLERYPRTNTHAKAYGCDKDVVIRTTNDIEAVEAVGGDIEKRTYVIASVKDIIWLHYQHIMKAIYDYCVDSTRVMFVRMLPEVSTDEDGNILVRTRLQFGDKDKATYPDKIDLPVNKEENPMQCDKCIHKSVCCHRDEYRALVAKVDAPAHPFKVTVECSEFRLVQPVVRNPQMYPHKPAPMNPRWHSPGPTCTERMEGTPNE